MDGKAAVAGVGPEQTYFQYLEAGQWRVPKCAACARVVFYPRIACPACGGLSFDWVAPSGLGTLYSTTVMRRPAAAGGDRNLCLVELDEGFRMMSRVEGVDAARPQIGDRVSAALHAQEGKNLVVFNLLEPLQ